MSLRINDSERSGPDRLTRTTKKKENECYIHIPCEILLQPDPDAVNVVRLVMCTIFAGNPEARFMDAAYEALCFFQRPMPHILLVYRSDGGNGKSARAILRDSVFAGHHMIMGPDMFQVPEEFRKQGCHYAAALAATIQEFQAGVPLVEDVFKSWISGAYLSCRPLFGKSTEKYRWANVGKWLEINNNTFPSINGDPDDIHSLKAYWRRLRVLLLAASFSGVAADLNVEGRVFKDNTMLTSILESPKIRHAYHVCQLLPFIQRHTAEECRHALLHPSEQVMANTKETVRQMAAGGAQPEHLFQDRSIS